MAKTRFGIGQALLTIAGLTAAAFAVRGAIQRRERAKAYLAEGIDEKDWITLGGIEQWVTVRGRDLDNPLLLVLHGGPGFAMSLFAHRAYPHWEEYFTVVNWDQRGAGRTFGRNGRKGCGKLTLGRMVVDGIELVEELRRRFPGRPVVLLGWSWGSLLGVEMIRARPDLFAAYVGVGQVVDMARGESLSYFGAIDRLRAKGDERGAAALERIGPPPYAKIASLIKQRRLLVSTMPKAERKALRIPFLELLTAPDARLKDVADYLRGLMFSLSELWSQIADWRMAEGGLTFETPMVILQGDLDLHTPTALVTEIAPKLHAPKVDLVIIEGGGHAALMAESDRFRRELVDRVRPFALGEAPRRAATARRKSGSSRPNARPGA